MINFDESFKTNFPLNWPYISDCLYRFLIIDGSGLGKTNVLMKLMKYERPDNDKIYLYVKNVFKSKYQLLIEGKNSSN